MPLLSLFILSLMANLTYENSTRAKDDEYCTGLRQNEDITVCLMNTVKEKNKTYTMEYDKYLASIETEQARPFNKKEISALAREVKKNWESYLIKQCFIESAIYEQNSKGFNDTYNLCLIKNYNQRAHYYKKNRF